MGTLLQDLKYGLRVLAKNPGFTAVAVLTLALGIGANTAIFTLVNAVLLNPLPVQNISRLAQVDTTDKKTQLGLANATRLGVSYPNYRDYAQQARSFTGLAAYMPVTMTLSGQGEPKQFQGFLATANYFQVLGVQAALGRVFHPGDDQKPGGDTVAVLSYGLWARQFGADPNIVGKQLTLNGTSYTVIGVAKQGFKGTFLFASADQIWIPVSMHSQMLAGFIEKNFEDRRFLDFFCFGRLKPGVTLRQAGAEVQTIASRLEAQYPKDNEGRSAVLSPLSDAVVNVNLHSQVTLAGGMLMVIVGLVLLVACVNLANLLLAQMARREKEMCLRAALGADGRRLMRQSLTESLLLALLGGAAGLVIAYWGKTILWSYRPAFMAQTDLNLALDGHVLAFTLLITLLTGVLFGLAPAFKAGRPDLNEALKSSGRSGSLAWGRSRFRQFLIISEVALALVALAGAGLFLRSLSFASHIDPGFETQKLFTLDFDLASQHYTREHGEQYYRDSMERAAAVSGVQSTAVASIGPLAGGLARTIFLEGQDASTGHRGMLTTINDVSNGYFQTLGVPVLRGRVFEDTDRQGTALVAVVNKAMAQHFWPGQNPIGKRFHFIDDPTLREVVGEVDNTAQLLIGMAPQPIAYLPLTQDFSPNATLLVRTKGDPRQVIPAVRQQVQALDRNLALTNVATIGETLNLGLWAPRMAAELLGIFAALALVLASLGIYGVLSYSVSQRVQEVGIRMALGATPRRVLHLVVRQGMTLVLAGVALGIGGALLVTRFLSSLLFGIKPTDPLTYAAVALLLSAVSFLACYLPARRATKVDPMTALRYE